MDTIIKIIFAFIVVVHGLIHLMGFAKAFNYAEMSQLTQPISKSQGVIWLVTTLLFPATIPIFWLRKDWWWLIGFVAILASQYLIFTTWQDAKFGTIANVIILLAAVVGYGQWSFNQSIGRDVNQLKQVTQSNIQKTVSFKDLAVLPVPVERYFRFALIDGQRLIRVAEIRHKGEFNMGDKWIPFESTEHFSTNPPSFIWDADMTMASLMSVRVRDAYFQKKGSMLGKIFGLYAMVDAKDDEKLNAGALQRYLAEAGWQPTALLPSENLVWTPIDENRALATLTDGKMTVSLEFSFNEKGEITKVFTSARFKEMNGEYKPFPWECRLSDYREIDRMMIPMDGEVGWIMPEGYQPYWKGRVTEAKFEFEAEH
jgi:hypothetical protein